MCLNTPYIDFDSIDGIPSFRLELRCGTNMMKNQRKKNMSYSLSSTAKAMKVQY